MKKKFAYLFLIAGGLLALSSCEKEENMEVFVGGVYNYKMIALLKEADEMPVPPTTIAEEDRRYSFLDYMVPEGYSQTESGCYGYVDLGLSVKWSLTNLDNPLDPDKKVDFDEIYKEMKDRNGIVVVDKPEIEDLGYPKVLTYAEYQNNAGDNQIEERCREYIKYINEMKKTYKMAVEEYNNKIRGLYSLITFPGNEYRWGKTTPSDSKPNSGDGSPENFSGNPDYDAATAKMGEGWRTPTRAEWQELIDKCEWEYRGGNYIITGPSGKKIVLPTFRNNNTYMTSERANVPTSGLRDVYVFKLHINQGIQSMNAYTRTCIRPIYTKK